MANHILVVDDDKRLRSLLKKYLESEGFKVSTAENAGSAYGKIEKLSPDLMVLDVMMPGGSGIDLTRKIKASSTLPVLLLTAMGEPGDRIEGLESGADDYLTKPFEPKELSLRIKNLLGRKKSDSVVKFGNYTFSIETGDLKNNNSVVNLSSTELTLLTIFAKNINQPVSREDLAAKLNNISERSIDVQITRLRKKIEDDPKNPLYLQTARGKGYILRHRS